MKMLKYLANLGYGSRKEVEILMRQKTFTDHNLNPIWTDCPLAPEQILYRGQSLDPPPGMVLMLNKPVGVTCSHKDQGPLVYELFPARFSNRKPILSSVGRLDMDTSGLLLFTDDGALLHRLISPKTHIAKVYELISARPLESHYGDIFTKGGLMLEGETKPLLPALWEVTGTNSARLTLFEGRYHQVRRMLAAVGNHVESLHRSQFGPLSLEGLISGSWRLVSIDEINQVFVTGRA
jgi:16S rRNA pseudouridine516 synthase